MLAEKLAAKTKFSLFFSEPHPKPKQRKAGEDGSDKSRFPSSSPASLPMPLGAVIPGTAKTAQELQKD